MSVVPWPARPSKRFGSEATKQLLAAAEPSTEVEVESSLRRRRSVIALLLQTADSTALPRDARTRWLADADPAISVLGARVAFRDGDAAEKRRAAQRLVGMLPRANWMVRHDIETCLLSHPNASRQAVQAALPARPPAIDDFSAKAAADRVLLRVAQLLHLQRG